jgi:hypothetical protein
MKSITRVSNFVEFEDSSVLALSDSDSDSNLGGLIHDGSAHPATVFMVDVPVEEYPFTMPLPASATWIQIEEHRLALEEAKRKELAEREKFLLEQQATKGLS